MVDREGRDKYAEQLRHFAAGVLSVDDYEKRTDPLALGSNDAALCAVWRNVWCLYDDFRTERLRGEWAISAETRKWIAYSILFLNSDVEYCWPPFRQKIKYRFAGAAVATVDFFLAPLGFFVVDVFHLQNRWEHSMQPFHERQWKKRQQFMAQVGDPEFWPFLRREEYEAALKRPKFLRASLTN